MEVLISMFVLAVGLLGVAALIPAGRHEIVEAAKLDNASMVGRAAFRDIQVRGYLNPTGWVMDPSTTASYSLVYHPTTAPAKPFTSYNSGGPQPESARYVGYVIDPLGLTLPTLPFANVFPASALLANPMPAPPLIRIAPFAATTISGPQRYALFDSLCRSTFDQVLQPNAQNKDLPPTPRWFQPGGTAARRMNDGNYSWIATIVSDPTRLATTADVTVSVAVFYKRDLSSGGMDEVERQVEFPIANTPQSVSGWLRILDVPRDLNNKLKPVKPGQWIMLAGSKAATSDPDSSVFQYGYYRWFKVISAAPPEASGGVYNQQINLANPDWNCTATRTRAWLFDNIVNVYEKQMPLEVP
jgi:hypothetical protein